MSKFFVADLDRFLINTVAASDVLEQVCDGINMNSNDLVTVRKASEESGGSFDTWGYLNSLGSTALLNEVRQSFIDRCTESPIVYDDSEQLLTFLDDSKIPNLIVTMGGDEWQKIKLQAAGLDKRNHLVTREKNKGKIISSWRTRNGLYAPTGRTNTLGVETVLLGDDKAASFDGLPDDCWGYLLRRPDERVLKSQQGQVPPRVKTVSSLLEIIDDLSV